VHNSGCRVVITQERFLPLIKSVHASALKHLLVVEQGLPEEQDARFEARWRAVQPDDIATVIYTSGTTGDPKGVELSHLNVMSALRSWSAVLPLRPAGRLVSYLPAAHLADRFAVHYASLFTGSAVTSVDDPNDVMSGLIDTRPTAFLAVPRIWEKMKAALELRGVVDPAALQDEQRFAARASLGLDLLDYAVAGGAPTPPAVLEFFTNLGVRISDGWAMTENACSGTVNPLDDIRIGTVGKAVPGVELRLADDGELLQPLSVPRGSLDAIPDSLRAPSAEDGSLNSQESDLALDQSGSVDPR